MKTLGIIGKGRYGKFIAQKLDGLFAIEAYDVGDRDSQLERVAACDYVVLSIPLDAYEEVLPRIKKLLGAQSVIVDVCSVKLKALEKIEKYLPGRDVLAIHTLFGPATAPDGIEGQKMVIIRDAGSFQLHLEAQKFFEKLNLEVSQMDAKRHDQLMAEQHALTYFVAEALSDFGVSERPFSFPSYERLVALVNLFNVHSAGVMETIQQGNPYAAEMRKKFIQKLTEINDKYSDYEGPN